MCHPPHTFSHNPVTCPLNTMVHGEEHHIPVYIHCQLEEFYLNSTIGDK